MAGSSRPPEPVKAMLTTDQSGDVLVLLVDFGDNTESHASPELQQLLFGSGGSSMRDYYLEASFGSLAVGARLPAGIGPTSRIPTISATRSASTATSRTTRRDWWQRSCARPTRTLTSADSTTTTTGCG